MVGRVEARLRAEIALGQRAEGLLDQREAACAGCDPGTGGTVPQRSGDRPPRPRSSARDIRLGSAVRTIRLHDTRSGRAARARARRRRAASASTPAGRRSTAASTSATPGRSSSSRCSSASSSTRATRSRSSSTSPTSTTRSTTPRGARACRASELAREMTARYVADTDGLGLGRPDAEPLASETIGPIVDADRGADRARPRLRGRRRRLLPRALRPRVRLALAPRRRRDGPGRGRRGRRPQGGPARLRAVEGAEGGRGHRLGRALGPRAPGLAHRVLGDGRGAARRRLRDPRRRQRPRLPPPRERGGADALRAAAPSSRRSGCTTGCSSSAARRWPSSVGNIAPLPDVARATGAATRSSCSSAPATTASRWPFDDDAPRRRRRRGVRARARRRRARLVDGAVAGRTWRRCATLLRRAGRRLQHAARRSAALFEWIREANRARASRSGAPTCARCSACSASRTCSSDGSEAGAEDARAARAARGRARGEDFAEADRLRDELAARGWEVRDAADGPSSCPGEPSGRGRRRPAPRGSRPPPATCSTAATPCARRCAAGPAAGPRGLGDRRGARASRGCARRGVARRRRRRDRAQRAASHAHQGVCAEAGRYPYADARGAARAPTTRCIVALDEVQDPQNLGAIARTAECAGATGLVIRERRARRGHAGGRQGVGGRGRAPARSRACATSPTSSREAKEAGCWCYGADGARRRRAYDEPDYSGGVVLVLGAEGKGLRPRVARVLRRARRAAAARADRVAERRAPRRPLLLYGILQLRGDA